MPSLARFIEGQKPCSRPKMPRPLVAILLCVSRFSVPSVSWPNLTPSPSQIYRLDPSVHAIEDNVTNTDIHRRIHSHSIHRASIASHSKNEENAKQCWLEPNIGLTSVATMERHRWLFGRAFLPPATYPPPPPPCITTTGMTSHVLASVDGNLQHIYYVSDYTSSTCRWTFTLIFINSHRCNI